jgi:integrase
MKNAMPIMHPIREKWLKKDFKGFTAHCLRHTFRDRLRAVECPMDMIDQIGGWVEVS